ncbi:MAG: hypothetical protein ABIH65_02565 [Nanoarchaeota archaeon]
MKKEEMFLKIKKIGKNRLYLYIPKKNQNKIKFDFKDVIKLKITKGNINIETISKYNYLISIKKEIVKKLFIKEGDILRVSLEKINVKTRSDKIIYTGKLDILAFVPEETIKGSKIVIEEFFKDKTPYLRLCSFHSRGSSFNIEVKRFVDLNIFGKLLGQIQAEGSKTHFDNLEFCNKSLTELKDFLDFIYYLGINQERIFVKADYHPQIKNIKDEIKKFENFIGLKVNYLSPNDKGGVGFGFKIIVRSTIFSQTILNALAKLRPIIESKDLRFKELSDGYLAKLLNGDGNFEITSKKRKTIQSRLKITDGNLDYLNHYKRVLEKYGFHPHINEKYNIVRALCNLDLAKNLTGIGAFENNPNMERVLFFINSLEGRTSK